MGDRDTSATAQIQRLGRRFGETDDPGDDAESDESFWERYGVLFQLLTVAGAFGGLIASAASSAVDQAMGVTRTSGPVLLDTLWPVLAGVTLLAVAVCVVVVALSVRNL